MVTRRDGHKEKLLAHYARLDKPTAFYQFDGFVDGESVYPERMDDDGDLVTGGVTHELMSGICTVRLLIKAGTTKGDTLRLLEKIHARIKAQGLGAYASVVASEEARLDEDLCPRCGRDLEGFHSPLCQSPDGVLTELDDETVRRVLAFMERNGFFLSDLPF